MSRRTFPRVTLAGLLAAGLAAPAVAQPPQTAPAPRPKNTLQFSFAIPTRNFDLFAFPGRTLDLTWTYTPAAAVAPAPRPAATPAPCCEAACCDKACPAPTAATPVKVVMAGPARAVAAPPVAVAVRSTAATYRPLGTWYKEVPGAVVSVTFGPDGDTLTARVCGACDGTTASVTLTADCAITRDGTVHGVVTGGDVEVVAGKELPGADRQGLAAAVQGLVDQPFAFRCRPADGGLMVGRVRVAPGKPVPADLLPPDGLLTGKFRHAADGKVPAPKPAPAGEKARPAVSFNGLPVVHERVDYVQDLPVPGFGPPPCPVVPCPSGVPTDTWQVMVGTFGEMLNGPHPAPVPCTPPVIAPTTVCPAPVALTQPGYVQDIMVRTLDEMMNGPQVARVPGYNCVPMASGERRPYPPPAVVSAPVVLAQPRPVPCPPQVVVTAPCPAAPPMAVAPVTYTVPLPPPVAPAMPAVARHNGLPVGTWCREVGPLQTTLTVKDGALTMTATMTAEVDGKTVTQGLVVTADCYATRDGLVGVLTGADLILEGDLPDDQSSDAAKVLAEAGKLHQALADKPFALTCRVVDGCLMVGNVRLAVPKLDGGAYYGLEDGSLVAGRYKPGGEKRTPARKPVKVSTTGGMTLPSPRYLEHHPQYFPPEPAFPLARELAAQEVAAGRCEVAPEPREVVRPAAACDHACPGVGGLVGACPAAAKLTVADVITLAKAGLGDEVIVTQLRLTGSTFVLSIPDLVELRRAGVSNAVILEMQTGEPGGASRLTPERIHGGIMYRPDPNARVQQLLNQSEDLRQVSEQWRRFWFADQPSHLTPDRVHGGTW
jgi:hypothetical protein